MEQKTRKVDRIASSKDEEKEEYLSLSCGADTGSMTCSDGAQISSREDDWKL